jgi:hypothetical protein
MARGRVPVWSVRQFGLTLTVAWIVSAVAVVAYRPLEDVLARRLYRFGTSGQRPSAQRPARTAWTGSGAAGGKATRKVAVRRRASRM